MDFYHRDYQTHGPVLIRTIINSEDHDQVIWVYAVDRVDQRLWMTIPEGELEEKLISGWKLTGDEIDRLEREAVYAGERWGTLMSAPIAHATMMDAMRLVLHAKGIDLTGLSREEIEVLRAAEESVVKSEIHPN